MSDTLRSVEIERAGLGRYTARNVRGGTVSMGGGDNLDFSPVELLLAAIGGCTAADVDHITAKRAAPEKFSITVSGDKIRDEQGNRMTNLTVEFAVTFPDGDAGNAARDTLPKAVQMSHDRLCTVSRTVELGTPIRNEIA